MNTDEILAVFNERERRYLAANDLYMARLLAIHRLRSDGLSLRKIGEALNLSHERVRQLLNEVPAA